MQNRIVWVLGAGFSRPLGGPLLRDLLTTSGRSNVLAAFPSLANNIHGPRKTVHNIYDQYRYKDEHSPGQRLWRDAEEFIDFLDTAALHDGPARARLLQLTADSKPDSAAALAFGARSMVAAECSAFLVGADVGTERWSPHVAWFQGLGPTDTIVTFNFDLVLERLDEKFPTKVSVVTPRTPQAKDRALVYKLHGSIDWKRIPGREATFEPGQPDGFALTAGPDELSVATPGPTKKKRAAEFEELWRAAEEAIEQASAVVFIGYRFPPTDAAARIRLLQALIANQSIYLAVHTVLGPRLNDDDTVRMKQLLHSAMEQAVRRKAEPTRVNHEGGPKSFTITQHPLWAEDFLGYVPGAHILQANLHFG